MVKGIRYGKKILSILLALILVLGLIPETAMTAKANGDVTGTDLTTLSVDEYGRIEIWDSGDYYLSKNFELRGENACLTLYGGTITLNLNGYDLSLEGLIVSNGCRELTITGSGKLKIYSDCLAGEKINITGGAEVYIDNTSDHIGFGCDTLTVDNSKLVVNTKSGPYESGINCSTINVNNGGSVEVYSEYEGAWDPECYGLYCDNLNMNNGTIIGYTNTISGIYVDNPSDGETTVYYGDAKDGSNLTSCTLKEYFSTYKENKKYIKMQGTCESKGSSSGGNTEVDWTCASLYYANATLQGGNSYIVQDSVTVSGFQISGADPVNLKLESGVTLNINGEIGLNGTTLNIYGPGKIFINGSLQITNITINDDATLKVSGSFPDSFSYTEGGGLLINKGTVIAYNSHECLGGISEDIGFITMVNGVLKAGKKEDGSDAEVVEELSYEGHTFYDTYSIRETSNYMCFSVAEASSTNPVQSIKDSSTQSTADREIHLKMGETASVSVEVYPSWADYENIVWSADGFYAQVNGGAINDGVSTAMIKGITPLPNSCAYVTATETSSHKSFTYIVYVEPFELSYDNPKPSSEETNAKLNITADASNEDDISSEVTIKFDPAGDMVSSDKISWRSSDGNVASAQTLSVNTEDGIITGKITGKKVGTANITASVENADKSLTYHVSVGVDVSVEISGITDQTHEIGKGETEQLTAVVHPAGFISQSGVIWSSNNTSVATVSETGLLTAVAKGTAVITATAKEDRTKSASFTLTVGNPRVASVTMDNKPLALVHGGAGKLSATILPDDVSEEDKVITWSSDHNDVATVDASGNVNAVGIGQATITATSRDGRKKDTCTVTVKPNLVTAVSLDRKTLDLYLAEGVTGSLQATTTIELPSANTYDDTLVWKSSNESIATVDQNGVVTPKKKGTATITCIATNGTESAADDVSDTCAVTVYKAVGSIQMDKTLSLDLSETATLKPVISPAEAADSPLTWQSNNENVATVNQSGVVTPKNPGNAAITCYTNNGTEDTADDVSASCAVKVAKPATGMVISDTSLSLDRGESYTLTASVLPEDAFQDIVWYSSERDVAKVDENGVVSTYDTGTATIRAESGKNNAIYAECVITVNPAKIVSFLTEDQDGNQTVVATQSVRKGGRATEIEAPEQGDDIFLGWYRDKRRTLKFDFDAVSITYDAKAYAKWTYVYTVSFDTGAGGTAIEPQKIADGQKAVRPLDPTKENYAFKYWYVLDANGQEKEFDFGSAIKSRTTVYAKWNRTYTVSFDTTGSGVTIPAQTVESGALAVCPADPLRENYALLGWYKNAACTNPWNFETDSVTADVTLYPKWSRGYKVTFAAGGGPALDPVMVQEGGLVTEPGTQERDGYVFRGWYHDTAFATPWNFKQDTITGETTLYEKWNKIHTVSFVTNCPDSIEGQKVEDGTFAEEPEALSYKYFEFTGWYKDEELKEKWDFGKDTAKQDTTLYAGWIDPRPVIGYTDENGAEKEVHYFVLTEDTTTFEEGEFYAVDKEDVAILIPERIEARGTANLILTDDTSLIVPKGITVNDTFNIYGQAEGTGELFAGTTTGEDTTGDNWDAGIGTKGSGARYPQTNNTSINIYGGNVYARSKNGAGIGGGYSYNGSRIRIINAYVEAGGFRAMGKGDWGKQQGYLYLGEGLSLEGIGNGNSYSKLYIPLTESAGDQSIYLGFSFLRIGPARCAVTFDSRGGTKVATGQVFPGRRVTKPADPIMSPTVIFDRWTTDPEGTKAWDFENSVVNEDMTLYAQWKDERESISYIDENGAVKTAKVNVIDPDYPSTYEWRDGEFYAAYQNGPLNVTIKNTVRASGTVNLIIPDDSYLKFDGGLYVPANQGNNLKIYGQEDMSGICINDRSMLGSSVKPGLGQGVSETRVGSVMYYGSYDAAMESWQSGQKLEMTHDITLSYAKEITEGTYTIDLKGYNISLKKGKSGSIFIVKGGTLIIQDSYGRAAITGATDSAIKVYSGSVIQEGGVITGNTGKMGGGVYIEGGSYSIRSGEISYNKCEECGGGIYVGEGGTLNVSGKPTIRFNKIAATNADDNVCVEDCFTIDGQIEDRSVIGFNKHDSDGNAGAGIFAVAAPSYNGGVIAASDLRCLSSDDDLGVVNSEDGAYTRGKLTINLDLGGGSSDSAKERNGMIRLSCEVGAVPSEIDEITVTKEGKVFRKWVSASAQDPTALEDRAPYNTKAAITRAANLVAIWGEKPQYETDANSHVTVDENGNPTISDSGAVTTDSGATAQVGAGGSATITGDGSVVVNNAGTVSVGGSGTSVTVKNGGSATINSNPASLYDAVVVTGKGSTINVSGTSGVTLGENQSASVSKDGKFVAVTDNANSKVTFYSADSYGNITIPAGNNAVVDEYGRVANVKGGSVSQPEEGVTGMVLKDILARLVDVKAVFKVSGNVMDKNGTLSEQENLRVSDGASVLITLPDGIEAGAEYALYYLDVSSRSAYECTFDWNENKKCILAQATQFGYYALALRPHSHYFTYKAEGARITASCNGRCDIKDGLSIEMKAPQNPVYDGQPKEVTFNQDYNKEAFPGYISITYYKGNTRLSGAPTGVGTYEARIEGKEAVPRLTFTIKGQTPAITYTRKVKKADGSVAEVKVTTDQYLYIKKNANEPYHMTNGHVYVVSGNVTFYKGLVYEGDVVLLLQKGAKLTVKGGVKHVGSTLSIFAEDGAEDAVVEIFGDETTPALSGNIEIFGGNFSVAAENDGELFDEDISLTLGVGQQIEGLTGGILHEDGSITYTALQLDDVEDKLSVVQKDTKDQPAPAVTEEEALKAKIALDAGLKVTQTGNKVNIKWGKVAAADGYDVYLENCDIDFTKPCKTITKNSTTSARIAKVGGSSIDPEYEYTAKVDAYKLVDGKKVVIAESIVAQIVGRKHEKYTNAKGIQLSKSKLTLKAGKTAKIKAKTVLADKKKKKMTGEFGKEFRYASANPAVATVSKTGKIKAVGSGTCLVYVYARNGFSKTVKVTVK